MRYGQVSTSSTRRRRATAARRSARHLRLRQLTRGAAYTGIGRSLGTDYLRIADQPTGEELSYLRHTRGFAGNAVLPVINGGWSAEYPWPLIEKLAKLRIAGDGIDGYGCPPTSPIATGLVHMELNRGDGSLGTFVGLTEHGRHPFRTR